MWLKFITLTNGLILDLFSIFVFFMALTTFRGYLSIPATIIFVRSNGSGGKEKYYYNYYFFKLNAKKRIIQTRLLEAASNRKYQNIGKNPKFNAPPILPFPVFLIFYKRKKLCVTHQWHDQTCASRLLPHQKL